MPKPCPVCGGPVRYLGTLGKTKCYRCRNCGLDIEGSRKVS